jgi:hypothetical protein
MIGARSYDAAIALCGFIGFGFTAAFAFVFMWPDTGGVILVTVFGTFTVFSLLAAVAFLIDPKLNKKDGKARGTHVD